MAQNGDDGRDDIDEGFEPLSLEEMIKESEESGGFEDFLNRTANRGGKWSQSTSSQTAMPTSASGAGQFSGSSSSAKDATDSNEQKSVPSAIDLRLAIVNDPKYIENGFVKGVQDARAAGEVPEPVVKDLPEPPNPAPEEAQIAITEVTVHHHPIVGFYSSSNTHRVEEDDEMRLVHLNARNRGVDEMTCEEVQDIIRHMERQAVLSNRAQQGFREALEIHLMKMNLGQRAEALERDRAARAKLKPKAAGSTTTKRAKSSTGKVVGVPTADRKAADALHKLGFDKDECIERLRKDKKDMTTDYMAFIEKLYSGV